MNGVTVFQRIVLHLYRFSMIAPNPYDIPFTNAIKHLVCNSEVA